MKKSTKRKLFRVPRKLKKRLLKKITDNRERKEKLVRYLIYKSLLKKSNIKKWISNNSIQITGKINYTHFKGSFLDHE